MSRKVLNTPQADALMGSLRSMGYDFRAAIADIIDNSISANAHNIHISFPSDPLSPIFVTILDDGNGMDNKELFQAMKYGSYNSEFVRGERDLGRFGMGLKSASLSQCTKLTVVSKKANKVTAYCWDYEFIRIDSDWHMLELDSEDIEALPNIESLFKLETGTLVIWQNFDIIEKSSGGQIFSTLSDYKQTVSEYIALIYHRFLSSNELSIKINDYKVMPLDPFLEHSKKVTREREITLAIPDNEGIERQIIVQPYILPFMSDLSEKDKSLLGGIENFKTKQGYYVYRNRRLIIWGTWFGFPKDELTKNARIRVDIPNTLDDIWKIDIKKQNATIPLSIKNQLNRVIKDIMEKSVKQQKHRGRINKINSKIEYVWNRVETRDNLFYYEINKSSSIYKYIQSQLSDESMNLVDMLVEEIEQNIPIQQIYIDNSDSKITEKEIIDREQEIFERSIMLINIIKNINSDLKLSIDNLLNSEPFSNFKGLKDKLYKYYNL